MREQRLAELGERGDRIVDPGEQHRLIQDRCACLCKVGTGAPHLRIDLACVIGMDHDDLLQCDAGQPVQQPASMRSGSTTG